MSLLVRRMQELAQEDSFLLTAVSADVTFQTISHTSRSNFLPGIALDALRDIPELQSIREILAQTLIPQVSPLDSVNYWHSSAPEQHTRPYPDDLDTVACVLAGLAHHDPSRLNGDALARLVQLLIRVEAAEGGPYKTWLSPPNEDAIWQDTDVAVNANIAYLLSLYDVRLEALDAWLGSAILEGRLTSPYYPSVFPLWYFLARGYTGPAVTQLLGEILGRQSPNGGWGNIQDTALALTALQRLGAPREAIERGRLFLITALAQPIAPSAFCMDSLFKGVAMYAGSETLTVALCLEALALTENGSISPMKSISLTAQETGVREKVTNLITMRINQCREPLRSSFSDTLHRVTGGRHGDEILLLPFRFHEALLPSARHTNSRIPLQLGAANAYGWMAYTLYDDILDGDADGSLLPVANTCLREVTRIFETLAAENPLITKIFHHIMDTLEAANAWEVGQTRVSARDAQGLPMGSLPDYGAYEKLADRSLGHALGPVTLLLMSGRVQEAQVLLRFFRQYLIARQLDDDAHDWEEDLRAGRINAVGALTLRAWRERGLTPDTSDADGIMALRRSFQRDLLPDVARLMLQHIEHAETAVREIQAWMDPTILLSLLKPVRDSAETALRTHRETRAFLDTIRITK